MKTVCVPFVTTGGLWVRNGDRWHVDTRRDDGALVVTHLDGWGRVVLPADYAADHVALAYAVTVHKAQGVTVDHAVLLADSTTTGEHLYVGMSRGRLDNQACVVTDAASTGHGHSAPPTPVDILGAAMRRSSAEISATETLRGELDRSEDPDTLRRLHDQAVVYIEREAGPDRRPELHRLRQSQSTLPMLRNMVAGRQREVTRLDRDLTQVSRSLASDEADLDALTRPRRFRRLDRNAIAATQHRIDTQTGHLDRLQKDRARAAADLEGARKRLHHTERTVDRIPDVEAAIAKRRDWFDTHPAELAWEADLAGRLADKSKPTDPPEPEHEHSASAIEALLETIDLRTIDLSPRRPRTGFERRLDDALGVRRLDDPLDKLLRPPPRHGIDGPDIGLGL